MRRSPGAVQQSRGTSYPAEIPAPVGGWNTRDPITRMSPLDAKILDNWFPQTGQVVLREGSELHTTVTGTAKTLMPYNHTLGTVLFAATDAGIYDVSSSPAVLSTANTKGYCSYVQFANSAGTQYLWVCNGTDTPKYYNGAVWANAAITGIANSGDFINAWVFGHRLMLIPKNSDSFYFLAIDAIQGAATEYPLGNIFTKGGFLVAGARWTLDGGSGQDDYCVIITNQGEVAIFAGTNPASAASFSLVGVYQLAPPVGYRCLTQVGSDLYVLTRAGVFPLSRAIKSAVINYKDAVSDKIAPALVEAIGLYGDNEGWECIVYPDKDAMIVNVPISAGTLSAQYVMNTKTGSWCSFSGWPAMTFTVAQNVLYYGTASYVAVCWQTELYGDYIHGQATPQTVVGTCVTSYQTLGRRSGMKLPVLFRPNLAYYSIPEIRWGWSSDFEDPTVTSIIGAGPEVPLPIWDVAPWDTTDWIRGLEHPKNWHAITTVPGYQHALLLQIGSQYDTVAWSGCDLIVQPGGLM